MFLFLQKGGEYGRGGWGVQPPFLTVEATVLMTEGGVANRAPVDLKNIFRGGTGQREAECGKGGGWSGRRPVA
jgi:hypothetical protein